MLNSRFAHAAYTFLFLITTACSVQEYQETDKIEIFFGQEENKARYIAELKKNFFIGLKFNIKNITEIELSDVSSSELKCTGDILTSPGMIARYKVNPKVNLKQVDIRINLPCAVYHKQWDVMVRVKSQQGNYYIKQRLPVILSIEGPGYSAGPDNYSGKLPPEN